MRRSAAGKLAGEFQVAMTVKAGSKSHSLHWTLSPDESNPDFAFLPILVESARRDDSIVATVTSGLSINQLCEGRSDSFRANFLGLHFFNPPNVIVGTELIAGPGVGRLNVGRLAKRGLRAAGFAESLGRLRDRWCLSTS